MSREYGTEWNRLIIALKLVEMSPSTCTTENLNQLLNPEMVNTIMIIDHEYNLLLDVALVSQTWVDRGRWEDFRRMTNALVKLQKYRDTHVKS